MAKGAPHLTAEECHERAGVCAANARLAVSEPVALEFLRMAAQWRAMAERSIFLGSIEATNGAPITIGPSLRLV
jgi:hypothetical protein